MRKPKQPFPVLSSPRSQPGAARFPSGVPFLPHLLAGPGVLPIRLASSHDALVRLCGARWHSSPHTPCSCVGFLTEASCVGQEERGFMKRRQQSTCSRHRQQRCLRTGWWPRHKQRLHWLTPRLPRLAPGRWGWTPEALHPLQRLKGPSFSGKQNFLDSVTAVPLMTETQILASTWL